MHSILFILRGQSVFEIFELRYLFLKQSRQRLGGYRNLESVDASISLFSRSASWNRTI